MRRSFTPRPAARARREVLAVARDGLRSRLAAQRVALLTDAITAAAAPRRAAEWPERTEVEIRTPEADARALPTSPELTRPICVLVVDDLMAMRRLLARQLTRSGHLVVGEAGTAAEAGARARALALGGTPPDVVLLDFHLPDGLGTDVAARLSAAATAAERRPAGVVFCTGDVGAARAALAVAATARRDEAPWGGYSVLEKPVTADALDRAVREAAAGRGLVA